MNTLDEVILAGAMILTVLAFLIPQTVYISPMIHGIAVLVWLVGTWLLVTDAIAIYPTVTFLPLAVGLIGITFVIVHTIALLLPYLKGHKSEHVLYNERQGSFRTIIAQKTRKTVRY